MIELHSVTGPRGLWVLACGVAWLVGSVAAAARADEEPVLFNRDIRPIFSDTCFKCHGFDANTRKADLRLDTEEGAFAERDGITPLVPGHPDRSEAYRRITSDDPDERMPPPESNLSITVTQKDLLRRWIEQGAEYEKHWSLIPPARPQLPAVRDLDWARNPIDQFILARLEREGLTPSPEAPKHALIRRLYLDLTGLPPSLAELDAALKDTSADWYERLTDRLLDSPRYGERMAIEWLDASRYADTHGYHIDSGRDMWPWREWVIDAFNRNKPFDQFTVEQLAGDLLPDATLEQQVATGFNRNHMINFEGGAIPEEYHTAYIIDRVNTVGSVWLGLTIGCAQCHDHKYDPISQKEYYQLYAFFHNVPENGLDGRTGNAAPLVKVPSLAQQQRLKTQQAIVTDLEKQLAERAAAAEGDFVQWEERELSKLAAGAALPAGAQARYTFDEMKGEQVADALGKQTPGKIHGATAWTDGRHGGALRFDGQTYVDLGNALPLERSDKFSFGAWVHPTAADHGAIIARMDTDAGHRGYDLYYGGGQIFVHLISAWEANAVRVNTQASIELNKWTHVFVTYDGSGQATGVKIYLDGQPAELLTTHNTLTDTIRTDKPLLIGARNPTAKFKGIIDDVWLFGRELSAAEVAQVTGADRIRTILATPPEKRTAEQQTMLRKHYLEEHDAAYKRIAGDLTAARKEHEEIDAAIPTTMVMKEMQTPRDTFMLIRGEYDKKGEKVQADVPAALGTLADGASADRLGLAQWLVDPQHPLTARVIVNRHWQKYFGYGIVKTAEDMGSQGEWPVHPELLDWLATEFIRTGWNVKAMQRLMVTSAAYRQASVVTPDLHERDPENRLLARGPRFRLPAEVIRDQALAASGLLVGKIGGPSVFPYHPEGLWDEMAWGDANMAKNPFSAQTYVQDDGEKLYRRTLYTFWKRTVPPAQLATFDAPDRETCTVRRLRTNTPLQALVLMNDPTYVEAARKLAERIMLEARPTMDERIAFVFRTALSRPPTAREGQVLRELYQQRLADFRADPSSIEQLLSVGESPRNPSLDATELAAWTSVASVVLSLDEAITKG